MKYIISENQSDELFLKLLKRFNITYDISYHSDNGHDGIVAEVFLYKDGEIYGYKYGYLFHFNYDFPSDTLVYDGHWPHIEQRDEFALLPSEMVIGFFTDKVKTYLKNHIDNGYTRLKIK